VGYDSIAEAYDRFVRNRTLIHQVTVPAVLELCLGTGRVLDVACGQGVIARELAARGFEVTGTDISAALLEIARAEDRRAPRGIEYVLDDATTLERFEDATFDGATANLAVNDIDDLDGLMAAVARVLKQGGWFVSSAMHPCFWAPTFEEADGVRRPDYFREGRWWRSDDSPAGPVAKLGHQHRTLSTLLNALRPAGLVLDRIEEPRAGISPVATVLVIRAIKAPLQPAS